MFEIDENLSVPLQELLTAKLPWLFQDLGFSAVGSWYDPAHFGDSLVTLQSDRLNLQFDRDKGQVTVSVGPLSEPETWWGLIEVLQIIQDREIEPRYKLDVLAPLLQDNYPALVEALGPKLSETRQGVERRREERLKALNLPVAQSPAEKPNLFRRLFRR